MMEYLPMLVGIIILVIVAKFILSLSIGKIIGIIINAIIGCVLLYVINLTGFVNIEINWITSLVTGIFGIPGVIVLVVLAFFGII